MPSSLRSGRGNATGWSSCRDRAGSRQVISGPLRDQIGLLGALRPHDRVLVLLQLLGGERPVELARGAIEAL